MEDMKARGGETAPADAKDTSHMPTRNSASKADMAHYASPSKPQDMQRRASERQRRASERQRRASDWLRPAVSESKKDLTLRKLSKMFTMDGRAHRKRSLAQGAGAPSFFGNDIARRRSNAADGGAHQDSSFLRRVSKLVGLSNDVDTRRVAPESFAIESGDAAIAAAVAQRQRNSGSWAPSSSSSPEPSSDVEHDGYSGGEDDDDDETAAIANMATRGSLHKTLNEVANKNPRVSHGPGEGDQDGTLRKRKTRARRCSTASRGSLAMVDALSASEFSKSIMDAASLGPDAQNLDMSVLTSLVEPPSIPFYILDNDGAVVWAQGIVVVIASYVTLVVLPPLLVLEAIHTPASFGINMCLDAIFLFNVLLNFLTLPPVEEAAAIEANENTGVLPGLAPVDPVVKVYRKEGWWCIASYYIFQNGAATDILGAIPWDLIGLMAGGSRMIPGFPFLVCSRFARAKYVNLLSSKTNLGMLVKLMVSLFFVGHTLGVLWWLVALVEDFPRREFFYIHGDTYVSNSLSTRSFSDFAHLYIYMLFWGMRCCATFASDLVPESFIENTLCLFAIMVGLAFFAYILGDIFDVISSIKAKSKERRENLAAVLNWFETRRFDKDLQSRLLSHKLLHVNTYKGYEEKEMLQGLPQTMRRDITFSTRSPMIFSNKIFRLLNKTEDRGLIGPLCEALEPEVTVGGEIILTAGEDGNAMYFISRGMAHVVRHEEVIATLQRGDFFGEVAIILQCPRTAHVVSIYDMELFQLKATHLEHFMKMYSRFQKTIIKEARTRFNVAALSSPHSPKVMGHSGKQSGGLKRQDGAGGAAGGHGNNTWDRSFDELLSASIWGRVSGIESATTSGPNGVSSVVPTQGAACSVATAASHMGTWPAQDGTGKPRGKTGIILVGCRASEWEENGTLTVLREKGIEYAVHETTGNGDVRDGAYGRVFWFIKENALMSQPPAGSASAFEQLLELATLFGSGKGIKIVIVRSERAASPEPGPPSLQQQLPQQQQQQLPQHALKSFVDKLLHLARSAGVSVREISELRQTDGVRKVSIDDTKRPP